MKIVSAPGEWLTTAEVAAWLSVHINTIRRIPPSELPFMRFGKRGDRRYREVDVVAYINERMVNE